jgi:hypothetical protein
VLILEEELTKLRLQDIQVFTIVGDPEFVLTFRTEECDRPLQIYASVLSDGDINVRSYADFINYTLTQQADELLTIKIKRLVVQLLRYIDINDKEEVILRDVQNCKD